MARAIVDNWNDEVADDDLVVVLGDVALGGIQASLRTCRQLKGRKVLVCGNHDRPWVGNTRLPPAVRRGWKARYRIEGDFEWVGEAADLETIAFEVEPMVMISHFPWSTPWPGDLRFAPFHAPWAPDAWLVHGHVHDTWQVQGTQINVGVDVHGFRTVPKTWIEQVINTATAVGPTAVSGG
jgi:calcineurin-like phosphoesterase family protein